MKFSSCEIPLFDRHVIVAMDCEEHAAIQEFNAFCERREFPPTDLGVVPGANNGWCQVSYGDVYVWVLDEKYSILFHELVHAAFMLCDIINTPPHDEIIARLIEHMKLNLVDTLSPLDTPLTTK